MASVLKNTSYSLLRRLHAHRCEINSLRSSTATQIKERIDRTNVDCGDSSQVKQSELNVPDYFGVGNLFTVRDLFNARVHYGHKEGSLDPRMKPFLFGSRLGHLIFDLDQTAELLRTALNVAAHIAYRDGIILFVGQTPQNTLLIEQAAQECHEFAHTRVWRPGMFTNSTMMFGAMTRLPDLVIALNTLTTVLEEHTVVVEAAKMAIPLIGILDTNCNPNLVTYPVPGNDDTPSAIALFCRLFKEAILKGKEERKKLNS